MKITIEHYNNIHTSEIPNDSGIQEVADTLRGLLILTGYSDSNVDDVINTETGEYYKNLRKED